ncbi:MAG: h16, partial [Betaproteobacteria bacterium]|nr:h16 [Betaproteobacteria bacterium]
MGAGPYLCLVQWLFALTWTLYVAFLPQLAAGAGIERKWVIWLLVFDQAIFTLMDLAMGVAADRVAAGMRRLSGAIVMVSAVSCLAFLLLPYSASPALLTGLVVLWAVTSSALRAPPMALIAKCAPPSAAPRLAQLSMLGLGIAAACSPVLTTALRGLDPRLPFALASIGLLAAVSALHWCERSLQAATAPGGGKADAKTGDAAHASVWSARLVLVLVLLAFGLQIHASINSAPAYLRLAGAAGLDGLMALFWIAFGLAMAGSSGVSARLGAQRLLRGAVVLGAAALFVVYETDQLGLLITAQLVAGAAWALVLACVLPAAIAAGRSGREGRNTGLVFSVLALAALMRLGMVAGELNKTPEAAQLLPWLPAALWAAAALLCALGAG